MEQAILGCDFVAIDCEMTGLYPSDNSLHYLDDMEERYEEVSLLLLIGRLS